MRPKDSAQDVTFTPSPNEVSLYSNVARTVLTPEEAILIFGIRDIGDPTQAQVIGRVYVSLSHAKRLAATLPKLIAQHEEMFGEIPLDADVRLTEVGRKMIEEGVKKAEQQTGEINSSNE